MMRKKLWSFVFILGAMPSIAFGDGKFFYEEKIPVGIPYQRAILFFEDGRETLVLQSKYETAEAGDINSIGWVVPVPAVPELASMDAVYAEMPFFMLGHRTRPKVVYPVPIAILTGIIAMFSFLITKAIKSPTWKWWLITIGAAMGLILLWAILIPPMGKGERNYDAGVEILKAETVGIYDVKVIKGDDANAVTGWLEDNKFGYGQADSQIFDQYVKKDWCFVTAKVNKKADTKSRKISWRGLAAPLILRFDANEAVYPLALTAAAGSKTTILLYVFADHKMDCAGKLKLAFFGETFRPFTTHNFIVEPADFFDRTKPDSWHVSKFRGTLRPEQMNEDIVFKQARDDEPYREIKVKWR